MGMVGEGDPGSYNIGSRDPQQNSFKAWLMVLMISYTDFPKVCSNVEGDVVTQLSGQRDLLDPGPEVRKHLDGPLVNRHL